MGRWPLEAAVLLLCEMGILRLGLPVSLNFIEEKNGRVNTTWHYKSHVNLRMLLSLVLISVSELEVPQFFPNLPQQFEEVNP